MIYNRCKIPFLFFPRCHFYIQGDPYSHFKQRMKCDKNVFFHIPFFSEVKFSYNEMYTPLAGLYNSLSFDNGIPLCYYLQGRYRYFQHLDKFAHSYLYSSHFPQATVNVLFCQHIFLPILGLWMCKPKQCFLLHICVLFFCSMSSFCGWAYCCIDQQLSESVRSVRYFSPSQEEGNLLTIT